MAYNHLRTGTPLTLTNTSDFAVGSVLEQQAPLGLSRCPWDSTARISSQTGSSSATQCFWWTVTAAQQTENFWPYTGQHLLEGYRFTCGKREAPKSSLWSTCMPNITHGNRSVQFAPSSYATREALNWQRNRDVTVLIGIGLGHQHNPSTTVIKWGSHAMVAGDPSDRC